MIGLSLIILAAICKAIADTIAHHKSRSIFAKSKFWSSNGKVLPFTGKYKFDGWHICNSGMICAFIITAALHSPVLAWYYEIPIGGVSFILVFNLFYNKILLK